MVALLMDGSSLSPVDFADDEQAVMKINQGLLKHLLQSQRRLQMQCDSQIGSVTERAATLENEMREIQEAGKRELTRVDTSDSKQAKII